MSHPQFFCPHCVANLTNVACQLLGRADHTIYRLQIICHKCQRIVYFTLKYTIVLDSATAEPVKKG